MKEPRFFTCESCNIIIQEIQGQADCFSCDGTELKELQPGTTDAAQEKHVPVVTQNGNEITVQVGSVLHPMTEEHSIEWVYLQTQKGGQRVDLESTGEPSAKFLIAEGDKAIAAYAYCNLHGFWKTEV